jgi:hypothetical protein
MIATDDVFVGRVLRGRRHGASTCREGETDPAKAGSVSLDGQGEPISIISSGVAWEGTALKVCFKEIQSYPSLALARNKYRPP